MKEYENFDFEKTTKNSIENKTLLFIIKGHWISALVLIALIVVSGITFYDGIKDLYSSSDFIIRLAAIAILILWIIFAVSALGKVKDIFFKKNGK